MDWWGLVAGAVSGLAVQNVAYPVAQNRFQTWRKRRHFRAVERSSRIMEQRFGALVLVQAGWGTAGSFNRDTVTLNLGGGFDVTDPRVAAMRDEHTSQWLSDGFENGQQVGISALHISRISDRAEDEREGRNHRIVCTMHTYDYFDFLATHRLLLSGDAAEREVLAQIAGEANSRQPINGFANPFSVGLSVFCEDGDYLAVTRRTTSVRAGGSWHGGKIYNLVGENAAPRDFSRGLDGVVQSTPYLIAERGLWEELGLSAVQIDASKICLHSLAYALDLRDHKIFGHVLTGLSRDAVQNAWRHAPDRSESAGNDLIFHSVRTEADTRRLLRSIVDEAADWAPEAVFCTVRSVLVRHLLPPAAVNDILAG